LRGAERATAAVWSWVTLFSRGTRWGSNLCGVIGRNCSTMAEEVSEISAEEMDELLEACSEWRDSSDVEDAERVQREKAFKVIEAFLNKDDVSFQAREAAKMRWCLTSKLMGTNMNEPALESVIRDFVSNLMQAGYNTVSTLREITMEDLWEVYHSIMEYLDPQSLTTILRNCDDEPVLDLSGLPMLTKIPPIMELRGTFNLSGSKGIKTLPSGIVVSGSLCLRDSGITEIPEELEVSGDLYLNLCQQLSFIYSMEKVTIGGKLDLTGTRISSIPEDLKLHCGKDLELNSCVNLERIGRGLHVGGALNARHCKKLVEISSDIHVGAYIELQGSSGLTELPDNLPIAKGLGVTACSSLRALPDDLTKIEGNLFAANLPALCEAPSKLEVVTNILNFNSCQRLSRLPPNLKRVGMLELGFCKALVALPDNLKVDKDCNLTSCERLTKLPSGLEVSGSLNLTSCTFIEELPDDLSVGENLNLFGMRNLKKLPSGIHDQVEGAIYPWNCPELDLPDGWKVEGDCFLSFRQELEHLPENLEVSGDLWLANTSLTRLPVGLRVHQSIFASYCSYLARVGDDLDIPGNLTLRSCSQLEELGNNIVVGQTCELNDCVALLRIGNLEVKGTLDLRGCQSLQQLPEDLKVGKDLVLDGCTGINRVPPCVYNWGPTEDGNPHNVYLGGTGIPQEELERLQEVRNPNLRFHVQRQLSFFELFARNLFGGGGGGIFFGEEKPFETLDEAVRFWSRLAGLTNEEDMLVLDPYVDKANQRGVLLFLSKLRMAKEFNDENLKEGLAKRVLEALETIAADDYSRDEIIARMSDSIDACGDKPIWALNQITLISMIAKARGDREALRKVGLGVMRLEIVHEHVLKKIASLSFVDDVCVYLRFEIALKEELDLPVSAQEMLFPRYIKVTDEEIKAAKKDALEITDEQFEEWLDNWPEWQRQKRFEVAEEVKFSDLKRNSRRFSLSWSDLFGNTDIPDPVRIGSKGSIWSMQDLLKHYVATGLDLNNSPRTIDEIRSMTRCRSLPRGFQKKKLETGDEVASGDNSTEDRRPPSIPEEEEVFVPLQEKGKRLSFFRRSQGKKEFDTITNDS